MYVEYNGNSNIRESIDIDEIIMMLDGKMVEVKNKYIIV